MGSARARSGGCGRWREILSRGGSSVWCRGEHGNPVGGSVSPARQRGRRADGRTPATIDRGGASRLADRALRGLVHAARVGGRIGGARAQGRLSDGLELRSRRRAQLQKKPCWLASKTA